MEQAARSSRNRTIRLDPGENDALLARCLTGLPEGRCGKTEFAAGGRFDDSVFCADGLTILRGLPDGVADLVLFDPPYNLRKSYDGWTFMPKDDEAYRYWLEPWIIEIRRVLHPEGSLYICSDWKSSIAAYQCIASSFFVRNRITWEREKGRASNTNWKNVSEDIWFATKSETYHFDPSAVKIRRMVRAPYRDTEGRPKDWTVGISENRVRTGFRDTAAGNLWTDLTVPFWSMPENTDHPTQKPEKLAAKLILASSMPGSLVVDPCAGSGSFLVAAKKLGRRYIGIEQQASYAALCVKRLDLAVAGGRIQGYEDGIFYERNSGPGV